MHPFTKTILACVFALFLAAPARGESGKEESFANENCALTPPVGWSALKGVNQQGMFAAFGNAGRSRIIVLMARERGHAAEELGDANIKAFDQGVEEAGGGPRLSGRFVEVAGYRAYERRGTVDTKGNHLSTLMIAISTGDGIYVLEGLSTAGDAADDAGIRQSFASFRFLHPPGPALSDLYYRLGYIMGQVAVVGLVVGLAIWLIVKAIARRRVSPPAATPGLYPYPTGTFQRPSPPPGPSEPPPLP